MASVSTPKTFRDLAEAHQAVRSPLERLRGYIRGYVGLEGAALVGLFLALWFWIGLALDYGFFKFFRIDWVQELPWAFRCWLLVFLLAWLAAALVLRVCTRLFREFREPTLALVLERRFPDVLGDRLITAVELSDPEAAARLGYSSAMVRETIHEAARRVETVPIGEVFDWKRLVRRGLVVGLLVLGGYLLVGGAFTALASARQHGFTMAGYSDLHDVALLWIERNVLLQNRIWPRRAQLELVDFPESGEVRMGRGGTPPTVRVRALKYVVSGAPTAAARRAYASWIESHKGAVTDPEAALDAFLQRPEEGWRALSWFDLTADLLGMPVPAVELPADWRPRRAAAGLTLDEIELKLDKEETHKTLSPEVQKALRDVLAQLDVRGRASGMSRTLRVLQVPEEVFLLYRARNTNSRNMLQRVSDNEYTGQFGDLKETVTFNVQGEDYYTATRRVVVVEPPALDSLTRVEERPAYLYYRVLPPEELRGAKQLFEATGVSLQGGEISRIDLPAGSNVTLTAVASKDLESVRVVSRKTGPALKMPAVKMLDDGRTFSVRFEDVREELPFTFEFTDADGVAGARKVTLVASEDAPPKVRELSPDDIVRKVKDGYMVAAGARIPFKGKVSDDYGLSAVRYLYSFGPLQSGKPSDRLRLQLALLPLAALAPGGAPLIATGDAAEALSLGRAAEKSEKPRTVDTLALPRFEQALRERKETPPMPIAEIRRLLGRKLRLPYRSLLNEFEIRPDEWSKAEEDPVGCDFPLWKLNLRETDLRLTQPRYLMELRLEAVDTDADGTGEDGRPRPPHVKVSEEKFTFLVVSENELLAEIAKEEEKLYADLDGAIGKLLETETKLAQVNLDLSAEGIKPDNLGPMSVRCEQVIEALDKEQVTVREVAAAYAKIDKEMRTNQVNAKLIDKVEATIVKPLAEADALFDRTRDRVLDFRKSLDNNELAVDPRVEAARVAGAVAKVEMKALMDHLNKVLASMQGLTDINKLVKIIAEIEKQERDQFDQIKTLKEALEKQLIDSALEDDKPKDKKPGK